MSAPIEDGGPAFPTGFDPGRVAPDLGMSLRDWFAGQAVGHLIAEMLNDGASRREIVRERDGLDRAYATCAQGAYGIADAMLAARQKGRP